MPDNELRITAVDPSSEQITVRIAALAKSVDSYMKSLAVDEDGYIEDAVILKTAEKFEKWIARKVVTRDAE